MRPAEAIASARGERPARAGPPGGAAAPRGPRPAGGALPRYAEALAAAAAASALRLLLEPLLDGQAPFHLALLATAWAAARGGFGPALLAGSAGLVAALALLPPRWEFAVSDPAQRNGALLYAATAFAVASVGGRLRAARARAEAALAARARAEHALSGEEAHTRAILDLSPQVLWTARPDGGMEDFAERWLAWTGLTRERALADGWARVAHPDDAPMTAKAWRRSVETGEACDVEHRVRMADGSFRWMRSRAVPRRDPATGAVLRWYGTTEDVHDRRAAEAALRESEARLRLFIERAPAAIAMFDAEMRYLAASRRFLLDYGLPVGETDALIGRSHYEFFPDLPGRWREVHRRVLAGETRSVADDPFPRSDGRTDWIRWEMAPWHRADGSVGGALLFSEVVTARVEAERALAESEARFRAAIAFAPFPILLHAEDGEILQASEAWQEISGWRWPEDIPTIADWTERAYGERRDAVRADIDRLYALDRRVDEGDYAIRSKHDGPRVWSFGSSPIGRDARGRRLVVSMAADVTDLRRAEAVLRRALAEQGAVYASAPVALGLHDRDLRFRAVNSRMAALNGLPVEAHLGRTPGEAVPAIAASVEPLLRRVLETGEPIGEVEVETETAAHPGERRHYLAAYYPVREEGVDGVDGVSVAVLDITGRKRAEAALRDLAATLEARVEERTRLLAETAAELDAFAYTVSHDLRAPLRAIEGFARILEEEHGEALDDAGRRYARRIVQAAERLDGLIQDLLAYSRLSRAEIEARPVPLEEVLDRALADLPEGAAEVAVERPLPSVLGARPVLGAMLGNLLSNAAKFTEAGRRPRVRVRAEPRPGGRVRLWVEDDGIGIAPEHLHRIFQVFERLHGQEHYPGTGIGLAIVRKGAERLGGGAGAESDGPGRGSRFWIELPGAGA